MDGFLLVSLENALLDISVTLADETLLNKYNLKINNALLADEKQKLLFDEIWEMEQRKSTPGGSALNSMRAANFMLKDTAPGKCAFLGCIGNDEFGKIIEQDLQDNGIVSYFYKTEEVKTGKAAVLVFQGERSLVGDIAANLKYPLQHLKDNLFVVQSASFLYTTCFYITSNYDALLLFLKTGIQNNQPIGLNISACYVIQSYTQQVLECLEYADYIFCNQDEAKCFGETLQIKYQSLDEIAKYISKMNKHTIGKQRIVIITQGADPVICASYQQGDSDAQIQFYEVPQIQKEKIVDTNGAGDSFVGGFLSQILQGKSIDIAIKAGIYLSGEIIQRTSCSLPPSNLFSY